MTVAGGQIGALAPNIIQHLGMLRLVSEFDLFDNKICWHSKRQW